MRQRCEVLNTLCRPCLSELEVIEIHDLNEAQKQLVKLNQRFLQLSL